MTARIVGFVSRAEAGLRAPKSVSRNITPGNGGVAGHYGGPAQPAANPGSDHAKCISTWRAWQNYHMNTKGWTDIAYTGGFCNHGYAFAGRGAGVRTGANGTNVGNQNWYAAVWIGGEGQQPTQAAIDAFEWWVQQLRATGGAARGVKPHRWFKSTGCPGDPLVGHCVRLDGRDLGSTPAPPPPAGKLGERILSLTDPLMRGDDVKELQTLLNRWRPEAKLTTDGVYGPTTNHWVHVFMKEVMGVDTQDPQVGPKTVAALRAAQPAAPAPTPAPSTHLARRLSMILIYANRGSLDADLASALLSASGAAAAVTTSPKLAKDVLGTITGASGDARLLIVGGPSVKPVLDREAELGVKWHREGKVATVVGQTALDTARLLADVAGKGWQP